MRIWMKLSIFVLLVSACYGCSRETAQSVNNVTNRSLPDGWKKSVSLPLVMDESGSVLVQKATIEAWVDQGWLVVRRVSDEGNTQWQCVLASANAGEDIKANVDERSGGFKIEFGRFFVSETHGDIRISRQLKQAGDQWPTIDITPVKELASGQMKSKGIKLAGGQIDEWCWVTSGLADGDRHDIWLRLEHLEFKGRGYGGAGGFRPAQFFFGERRVEDDGELFIASRSTDEMVAALFQKKQTQELMKNGIVPELSYGETFNVPSSVDLSKLRGTPVLLDFWGTWCGPCVKNLPKVEAIYKKFADKGLTVIGVHSNKASESVAEFLKENDITFPVVVDTGDSAKAYRIESYPTYFLIDRQGKVVEGFTNHPPSDEAIRKLLN